jgi:iron(III) transport system ATP-binding protein
MHGSPLAIAFRLRRPTRSPEDSGANLRGEVVDSAYRGRGYDHVVRLPDAIQLSEIFSVNSHGRGQAIIVMTNK